MDNEAQTLCEQQKKSLAKKKELVAAEKAKAAAAKRQGTDGAAAAKVTQKKKTAKVAQKKKKTKVAQKKNTAEGCALKVGMRVQGHWLDDGSDCDSDREGDWYDGVVHAIDYVKRTVHIKYDDGDSDDSVSWDNTRILEDFSEG